MVVNLETAPERIKNLPIDSRGYPVPWFVQWMDGKPEFRLMDQEKWIRSIKEELCWVCGDRMGAFKVFVVGPMCGINRTTAEPPTHKDCAEWSAKNCPFLSNPSMTRREDELTKSCEPNVAGIMIKRNPGVTLLWTTKNYKVFDDGQGRPLIQMGEPVSVDWYYEGKPATREQVVTSIEAGCPALEKIAIKESIEALTAYQEMKQKLEMFYPRGE